MGERHITGDTDIAGVQPFGNHVAGRRPAVVAHLERVLACTFRGPDAGIAQARRLARHLHFVLNRQPQGAVEANAELHFVSPVVGPPSRIRFGVRVMMRGELGAGKPVTPILAFPRQGGRNFGNALAGRLLATDGRVRHVLDEVCDGRVVEVALAVVDQGADHLLHQAGDWKGHAKIHAG